MEYKARCNGIFRNSSGLRAYLTDVESWHHKLIKFFLNEIYDTKPDKYDERIVPMPINK